MTLDGWTFIEIPYLSIQEEPSRCRQLVLAFIGKFTSLDAPSELSALEAETLRYARRAIHPFQSHDLAKYLRITERHANRLLITDMKDC